jgi:Tat protein translocase TatC
VPEASSRGEMPFLDHLEELRWRILWSLLAIAVGMAVGWVLVDKFEIIEVLKRPIAPYLRGGRLAFTSPAEPFMLHLKVAFGLGCLLASPVVIYQAWAFLAPALYERERRLIVPALSAGVVLFLAGAVACYAWLLPAALKVLMGFQGTDLEPVITIDRYFGMAIPFIVACGAIAELPLVVTILAALGLVTPQFLARQRRYALVIAAFVAALLTPPDAVSMLMMLVPLLLLYEVSIWCAWVAGRRRARREAAAGAGTARLLLLLVWPTSLASQGNPPPKPPPQTPPKAGQDTTARPGPGGGVGRTLDSATARKLGLPTGPTRSFPANDPIIDSLVKLQGFQVTRYVAETLVVVGDSQEIHLRREAFVDRDGTKLEADSIRYREASCRLDATGEPKLFDQGTVLVGERMRYDTCTRRGTVSDALTDFQQGGATWYMRGDLAVDSGSTRVYGKGAEFTTDNQPVPDYHFAAGQVKWINKSTMVARPVVLYVRDVPIMWLPFMPNDIRSGRHSGVLVPKFGLNDLVRPTRGYQRQVTGFGYYFALNDYMDLQLWTDWYAGRSLSFNAQSSYRWLDRFIQGGVSYTRMQELDGPLRASHIRWYHSQQFDSRTNFNANVDYSTSARVLQRNSLDPNLATASLGSSGFFNKRFPWGTLTIGGSRQQELSRNSVSQTLPDIRLAPSAINITPTISWSPGFTFTNQQTFHQSVGSLLVPSLPGDTVPVDTLPLFADARTTTITIATPIRVGRWTWGNNVSVRDVVSNKRQEFAIRDSTQPGGIRRVLYAQTFSTEVDWGTSINLPSFFMGTWKLQPSVSILNQTGAGPFMLRNQFSGGEYVRQDKRLAFSASLSPTFFGFFPGVGPLARIRHGISPTISWQYAPGSRVNDEYARAVDPEGRNPNVRSDPQQTISLSLSQTIEAKLTPPPGDTTSEPRKIRLLSINTSGIGYNFEQAKQAGRVGWQTPSLVNTINSELVRGFSLTITHDLWDGTVGFDSTRFDPFLSSISVSSFTLTPASFKGVAALVGLGGLFGGAGPARPEVPPAADTAGAGGAGGFQRDPNRPPVGPMQQGPGAASQGFSLMLSFSSNRSRGETAEDRARGGRRVVRSSMHFRPTAHWTASWSTTYDLDTRRFADHYVHFERDLRRWRATFDISKSANGNFSFSFRIALIDQQDIKFDYDQRTIVR